MIQYRNVAISPHERDMILAALRLYQQVHDQTDGDLPDDIVDIATDSESHEAIDLEAIDDLCERINV
ncbi:hypothetical protein [Tianweitania sediminis]|uniref:Uncharacterized protein n=1 Tax=Tianweitania sediminis TaxID=1502156 RepID=A0A8J7R1J1_9HYPH|nr:hypothetical protein [Tianweitania sediminis]MBP0440465.1 hypothetical protein [Tianweitania sediminis]